MQRGKLARGGQTEQGEVFCAACDIDGPAGPVAIPVAAGKVALESRKARCCGGFLRQVAVIAVGLFQGVLGQAGLGGGVAAEVFPPNQQESVLVGRVQRGNQRAAGEESFEMVVPAIRIANFHFSEVTKY